MTNALQELWDGAGSLTRNFLCTLFQDLRYGAQSLARTRAFTIVAILSLALGIGANTALFSLMNAMLLRALPVKNPQRLVEFARAEGPTMMTNLPYAVFTHFKQDRTVLQDIFAVWESEAVFRVASAPPEKVSCHLVSPSFFPALGKNALIGRTITEEQEQPGTPNRTAVLSYGFWARRFGRDPSILGATARVNGELFTVIGVMPHDFFGVDRSEVPEIWIPFGPNTEPRSQTWVLGHLKDGISTTQAGAALAPLFHDALESFGDETKDWPEQERASFLSQRLLVHSASNGTAGLRWTYWEYSNTLKILIGLTGLILLIACANLANLVMARSVARSREIGIRLAVGAGRWRIARQLLTENLLLALAGGAVGLLVARWGHRLMLGFLVNTSALEFRLDYRILGFGLILSGITALLFGLVPAIRATRTDPAAVIHAEHSQRGPANLPLAKVLLMAQVGLSLVLLVGAGLFARSLRNLGTADLGLARENLLLMNISAEDRPQQLQQLWAQVTEEISGLPGVRGVALAGDAVFGNGGWNEDIRTAGSDQQLEEGRVPFNMVGPGFFSTVGIPLLIGREFGEADRENSPKVAVVNQSFAHRFFGNESPIGKRFGEGGRASPDQYEIVGMVADAKYGAVREANSPMMFQAMLQQPVRGSYVLHVRTTAEPASLAPSIVHQIHMIDGEALVTDTRTLSEVVHRQLSQDRMFATLAVFFALLALLLGCIGIYGVVAYRMERRTAEIGLRIALGAQRADVLWLTMRETVVLLVGGVLIGLPVTLATTRLIKQFLFGLEPQDPTTLICATIALLGAGALAALLPARRAMKTDPMVALRYE